MESRKTSRSLSLKRSSNQSVDSIYFDRSTTDGLPPLDKATVTLIKVTVNKVVTVERNISQIKSSVESLEAHLVAGTFPPSLKPSPKKATGAKEIRETLQLEFNAHAESIAKADLEAVIKSKKALLTSKTAEQKLLLEEFKSNVDKATKNTIIDEWTSKEYLKALKDRIMDSFRSYLTTRRFGQNLTLPKQKSQNARTTSNSGYPMETDEPVTNQSLRNYLDNYVSERGIICKPKKGQSKQQPRGHSRSRKLSKQGKPSSSQNRKLQQSPRKRSVSKSVNRSSSVSFEPKNSQKRKGKGRNKDHD